MPALILLARHGTHDEVGRVLSGRSEIALNSAGQRQAEGLAALLAGRRLGAIYSSPRRRCRQTAVPPAERSGLPIRIAAALDEIDFGSFTARSFAALDAEPEWRRWNAERGFARCPGGETMAEAVDRAAGWLTALPDADPVLCVTHCDVIRGVVARSLGIGFEHLFALPCDPGSLTTLALEGEMLRLVTLNARPDQPADQ